jgi:hypothetical protein
MPNVTPTQVQNGNSQDLFNVSNILGVGVYQPPICVFNCIPQSNAALSLQIVAFNNAQADVPLPLVGANLQTIEGIPVPVIPLDCQRGLLLERENLVDFTEDGTVTFTGYDSNYLEVINTVSFTTSEYSVASTKTFKYISSVELNVDMSTVECFPNYVIGLPYYLPRVGNVISCVYNAIANPAPFSYANITPGNNWRIEAPSATSGDANGTVTLPNSSNNEVLTVCYYVVGADSYLQAQLLTDGANGQINSSAQKIIYANDDENPIVAVPVLIPFDETGVQYPADMTVYNNLPTS